MLRLAAPRNISADPPAIERESSSWSTAAKGENSTPVDLGEDGATSKIQLPAVMRAAVGRLSIAGMLLGRGKNRVAQEPPRDGSFHSNAESDKLGKHPHGHGKHIQSMDGTVSAVAVSAHDKFYAAASMSGQVKIFSVEHGTVVDEFKIQGTHANALAFLETSYGQALLVGTNHGQVVARHVERKEELATVTFDEKGSSMRVEDEHGGPKQYSEVHALAVSRPFDKEGHADGDAIMAVGGKLVQPPDFVEVFTVAQQPFMGVLETANKSPVRNSGMRGSGITDAPLQPMVITLRARLRTIGTLTRTVSLDRDGTILVAGGDARVVQMWSLRRARSKGVWSAVKPEVEFRCVSTIQSLAIAPKGDILAVGLSAHAAGEEGEGTGGSTRSTARLSRPHSLSLECGRSRVATCRARRRNTLRHRPFTRPTRPRSASNCNVRPRCAPFRPLRRYRDRLPT